MPLMTQNDFLNPLFSLPPIVVGLVIWFTGWGSLFLLAWKNNAITTILLRHPGFMIGDFLMLPLAGGLITYFYQSIDNPINSVTSTKITYLGILFALAFTALVTIGSIFVTKSYHGIWSAPHTIFICFFAYILFNFLVKGMMQLLSNSTTSLWLLYVGVILAVVIHFSLQLIFWPKHFPVITGA